MNMNELIKKFDEAYDIMVSSRDPMRMMAFGEADRWFFHRLAEHHPDMAKEWLARHERGAWNNYLSREEAEHVVNSLVERNGDVEERKYHWEYEDMKTAIESIGGKVAESPCYNCYAMWATMNMLYSDHHETVNAYVQPPMRIKFYYRMAKDKLKDVDRPHFVRPYFGLEE